VMFVAWGTETNVPDTDSGTPLDLYLTRTTNQGASYEKLQVLAGGPNEQSETQLRSPPDGKSVGALWMEHDATSGAIDVMYRNGLEAVAPDEPAPEPVPSLGSNAGCAIGGDGRLDPTLPALLAAALAFLGLRRRMAK
jgi:hypothetical protein